MANLEAMLSLPVRPSVALLSRAAFHNNLKVVKSRAQQATSLHQERSQVMAVIKANAYGHDIPSILPALRKAGIRRYCVASIEEGVEIRKFDKKAQVLILGGTLQWSRHSVQLVKKHRFEVGINDLNSLKVFLKHKSVPIHLKLDTGMNRLGVKPTEWGQALDMLRKQTRPLEGLYTHFATFQGSGFKRQVMLFEEALSWFLSEGFSPRWIHSENSAALFSKEKLPRGLISERANLIRPGLALFGYMPKGFPFAPSLKPVLELVSEIGLVKRVEKGEGISYDHLYRATKAHHYGVIPLGYADGVAKEYGQELKLRWYDSTGNNKGWLRICGAICMDMIIVKPMRGKLKQKDRVVLWGQSNRELVKHGIADPYELNLRIARRIPRVWVS